jgi:hypothetical protein
VAVSGIELQNRIASSLIDLVPRVIQCKFEANLHIKHKDVFCCVKALFTETIVFLVKSREYFCLSKPRRLIKAAFSGDFDEILGNVQSCLGNLDRALNSATRQGVF